MSVLATSSLADYLAPVAARTSSSLVSPDSFLQLQSVARTLPGSLSSTFGLECPLGDDTPRADLLVGIRELHGRHRLVELVQDGSQHPGVARLQAFADAWADPVSPVGSALDNLWLEFDLDGADRHVPSVFFGFRTTGPEGGSVPGDDARGQLDRRFAASWAAVRLLRGGGPASTAALRQGFRGGPGAEVFQVGVMLSRATDVLRLCLRLRSLDAASSYLERIGWGGDAAALLDDLAPLARFADYVCLDVDIGGHAQPKVGLECYLEHRGRWRPFLDALVARGLCTTAKRDGLLAYPGQDTADELGGSWPSALRSASRVLGSRYRGACLRSIHHVKVVRDTHDPYGPLGAKAYLAVNYRWKDA